MGCMVALYRVHPHYYLSMLQGQCMYGCDCPVSSFRSFSRGMFLGLEHVGIEILAHADLVRNPALFVCTILCLCTDTSKHTRHCAIKAATLASWLKAHAPEVCTRRHARGFCIGIGDDFCSIRSVIVSIFGSIFSIEVTIGLKFKAPGHEMSVTHMSNVLVNCGHC